MIDSSVHFQVKYPEKLSRGILLLRALFGTIYVMIPHGFMLGIYGIGAGFLLFFSWWTILFTGKYPQGWFNYLVGYQRYYLRVMLYMMYMTDQYPPFGLKDDVPGYDACSYTVDYPETLSRGTLLLKTLFGSLYVMIPHGFCLFFVGIGASFLSFFAWWAILFTGKYPENWFKYMTRFMRWGLRVAAYMSFYMTDKYPPFTGEE